MSSSVGPYLPCRAVSHSDPMSRKMIGCMRISAMPQMDLSSNVFNLTRPHHLSGYGGMRQHTHDHCHTEEHLFCARPSNLANRVDRLGILASLVPIHLKNGQTTSPLPLPSGRKPAAYKTHRSAWTSDLRKELLAPMTPKNLSR